MWRKKTKFRKIKFKKSKSDAHAADKIFQIFWKEKRSTDFQAPKSGESDGRIKYLISKI